MENEFSSVMSQRSKSELIAIITTDRSKYQPLAIEAAEAEIKKRGIETQEFETLVQKNEVEVKKTAEFEAKNVGPEIRLVHFIVDLFAIAILHSAATLFAYFILPFTHSYLELAMFTIIFIGYYTIFESHYQKTLGKLITKTKVVNFYGEKPSFQDIFVRSICRFIPFDRVSYLFMKNGFHDGISKTTVIKDN